MPNLFTRTQLLSICFGLLVYQALSPAAAQITGASKPASCAAATCA